MYSPTYGFRKEIYSLLLALFAAPSLSWAGGLTLADQSAGASGTSNAGAAANPQDATTVYFNPAGMSRLSGTNVSAGLLLMDIDALGRDDATRATRADGRPVPGDGGGDHVGTIVVPNAYVTHEVNDWVDIGMGLFVPYGLGLDYEDGFAGRYLVDRIDLVSVGLSPSIAFNDGNGFSIGFGVNVLYASAEQENSVDYSGLEARFGLPAGTLEDGKVSLEGDDVALEFTFGMMFDLTPDTTLGFSGRTGTEFELQGKGTLSNAPQLSASGLVQTDVTERVQVPIQVPESLSIDIAHQLNPDWQLLAGATWAKWSRAAALSVVSRESTPVAFPAADDVTEEPQSWKDTWQWRLGAIWQATPRWALKAGYLFDESPVTLATRSPATPFEDYHQVSVGAQFQNPGNGWTVDMFVARVFYEGDISIDYKATDPAQGQTGFQSEYDIIPWNLGLQLSQSF
ncbi:OmpP1/FadL family transporter [Marinobacter sp. 1_MG-2023]|uniref:OmpP1/FadL family transporter n=1 Tax=Marinobacter sp. 1_MG-2023 TaxID=3062627 RepID=UPI0026E22236|nr:TonB-dependent receptor [Marinobacter sp. 1_MG-2023]MDO6824801.1 TonB-dependent receptor [Marinobacter sp. 1_MG-2023]